MTNLVIPVKAMVDWAWRKYRLPQVRTDNGFNIPFVMQRQVKDNWCWAAAASTVSFYLDELEPVDQKEIVASIHRLDVKQEIGDDWDLEGPLNEALSFVRCFRTCEFGAVSFRNVLRELEKGLPVIGHIAWKDGSDTGHAIGLSGCRIGSDNVRYFTCEDPGIDRDTWVCEMPMDRVLTNYCDVPGEWVATYFVQTPPTRSSWSS